MQTGSTVRFVATQVAWCVPVVAVAAVVLAFWSSIDGQNDLRMSRADSKPESVVDAHGSLHAHRVIARITSFWERGPSPPPTEPGPASCTMSMRAPARLPGTTQAATSPMERCWSKRSMRPPRLR